MKLIYGIEDKPKFSKTLVFAFQQMIAIMAATLLVPLLVTSYGLQADAAAALFGAGIGTIVYLFCTKRRSPVFLGSSFTFPRRVCCHNRSELRLLGHAHRRCVRRSCLRHHRSCHQGRRLRLGQ